MTQTAEPTLTADYLRTKFDAALDYDAYVASGEPDKQQRWNAFEQQVSLTAPQRELITNFTREMYVLVSSGLWCGDCVQQCPILAAIADANPGKIRLRFVDRDEHADLASQIMICGGHRVPTAVFMAEDFEPIQIFGDRTLTRYRILAEQALGAHCPVPGAPVPAQEVAAVTQDWVDIFERNQLLLRLSGRLRDKHGD